MECKGRLLMVSSWFSRVSYKTVKLEVHAMETSGTAASEGSWVRVKGIGGHALFVGDACSRAFPADAPTHERYSQDKIEDNQVCFVEDDEPTISPPPPSSCLPPARPVRRPLPSGRMFGADRAVALPQYLSVQFRWRS